MSIYNYVPNNWDGNNGVSINTTTLQKIETGIKSSHERINNIESEINQNTTDLVDTTNNIININGEIVSLQAFIDKFNLNGVNGQVLTLKDGEIILQSPINGETSIGNITQWESNKLYTENISTVIYNNGSFYGFYLCKITTANILFTPTDWELIGETGFIGAETTDILKNKTIDTTQNVVTNIGLDNWVTGLLQTDNTLGSNSDSKLASVKAIRAFVENKLSGIVGGLTRKGSLDASLGMLPNNVSEGWYFIVSKSGNVGVRLNVGDYLIANQTVVGNTNIGDWNVIPNILSSDILKLSDIIDSLTSTDATKVLSANQGRILKLALDSMNTLKADKVITPILNNFLSMDATGNLKDSGSKVTDFETPTGSQTKVDNSIIAIKNGVSTDGDTLLKLRGLITEVSGDSLFGNYTTTYAYDVNGKISGCTIIGDKSEITAYTYFITGENLGKINTESIQKDAKTVTNTFSYTSGKISGVITVTV